MVGKILGPDGQPVSSVDLNREIAVPTEIGVRAVSREGVASGLSPEGLAALLREAAGGQARRYLTLAEEMEERYLHYASQLQTRRLAIEAIDPAVEVPEGVDGKVGDAVHALVDGPGFREMIGELTDGIAKGYSCVEIIWDYAGGLLRPVSYTWRDPRFFQFDRVSLTELRLAVDGNLDGEPLPPGRFVRHMPRSKMGVPLRRGVARPAAWAFMLQSFSLKDWAAFSEVYGMPLRIGRYPASASPDDIRTLLRAVRSIASDAAAVIPIGMELEFARVDGQHGTAVFGGLLGYLDRQVSKIVVGQTMTADEGGSLAQARVHNEVRLDILRADGRQIGNTVSRDLIEWFVSFNFGPQAVYPRVTFPVSEPEDVAALTGALKDLVPLGLRVGQQEVREKIGLSAPQDDEAVLAAPAAAPALPAPPTRPALPAPAATHAGLHGHVAGCRCGGCLTRLAAGAPAAGVDGLDLVDRYLAEDVEWREVADPLLAPIVAAMAGAGSLDEALAAIGRRGPDGSRLLERLAVATAVARGIGDAAD
ncbi:DUF935 domain-containing protein [Methylobacterium aquaticum]|uniref:DUF935 domain-containing protein n=1 Tax=Methylobacterium aquaticum TaxID=270351 RepID=UPI003D162D21